MKNLAFEKVDSCFVLSIGKDNPDDVNWDLWVNYVRTNSRPGMKPRILVCTDGGSPTPAQRKKINEVTAQYAKEAKVALLTESAFARGVATALSWFFPIYRAFSPSEVDRAFEFLDLGPNTALGVRGAMRALEKQVRGK